MPVILIPTGLLLGGALLFLSAYAGIAVIILTALLAAYLFKKILVAIEAIYGKYARNRTGTKNLTIADVKELTVHAIRQYIERAGSGNLNSGDKWNFCLTSA